MIQEPSKDYAGLVPLEANPETLNHFLGLIGFDVQKYRFVDVFSTSDQDLLNLVPRPVLGLLLVKPSSGSTSITSDVDNNLTDVLHMSQTIGGSCGSLAVLHLIANLNNVNVSNGQLCQPGSWLESFLSGTKKDLDEEFCRLHNQAACHQSNQTSHTKVIPGRRVGTTFAAFVPIQVHDQNSTVLVELDGRKHGPIIHGATSSTTFLEDSCRWVEHDLMTNMPDGKFAILALATNKSEEE